MKQFIAIVLSSLALIANAGIFSPDATITTKDYQDNDKEIQLPIDFYKASNSGTAPTIIFGHNCAGVKEAYRNDIIWINTLRSWGYNVVVPDSFGPRGYGNICHDTTLVRASTRVRDIHDTVQWVKEQPWHSGKIGYIGFSHGGTVGEFISKIPKEGFKLWGLKARYVGVDAVVAYYPYCQRQMVKAKIPYMIHIGTGDTWTPSSKCETYIGEENYDVSIYQGAYHSFDRYRPSPTTYQGHTIGYDDNAAKVAEQKTRQFFDKILKP